MDPRSAPEDAGAALARAQIKTLLMLDMVDSTGMIERLGDLKAAEHIRRHDRFVRDLLKVHGGREIDKTDGFLLAFDRPIQAAAFALTYQRALKDNPELPIRTRIGLHVGEVVLYDNSADDIAAGAKTVELEGLAKPIAARLMSLALPGQILLSDMGHALISRSFGELQQRFSQVSLRDHGSWHLKGVHDAMHVHELGEPGVAPFQRPMDVEKVRHDRRRLLLASAAGIGALGIGSGSWWWWEHRPISIPFEKRDWVVISDFINTTREAFFDETLGQAFRIALEQSQFVNLVPEIQVQDSLKRMLRDPAKTVVNRQIACEVAQRESARAVIAPGISYRGTRLLLSAETLHPETGRTVHIEAVESDSREALLGSMDELVRKVRRSIGESAESTSSTPRLEEVTTSNLEALRAYALAVRATADGRHDQALSLYAKATELDPDFATAYARLATIHFVRENGQAMELALRAALARKSRLSARERDYLEAWFVTLTDPAQAVEKWSVVATLYPDFPGGQHNYGTFAWRLEGLFEEAIGAFDAVVASRHPLRGASFHHRGYCLLALSRFDDALQSFRNGVELARNPESSGLADALTATGRHTEALRYLDDPKGVSSPVFDIERCMRRSTCLADQGQIEQAELALQRGLELLPTQSPSAALGRLLLARIGLRISPKSTCDAWFDQSGEVDQELAARSRFDRATAQERLALAAFFAAWASDGTRFDQVAARYRNTTALDESSNARALYRAAQALRSNDRQFDAATTGSWPAMFHLAAARIAAHNEAPEQLQSNRDWLRQQRGQIFGNWNSQFAAQGFCVRQSRLLLAAEFEASAWLADS